MELIEAEHPRPRHFLLHLSDPHLLGGTAPLHGVVDSDALLQQLFDEVRASGARPEAVIFTGDLADRGEPEAYAKLRAIVEPACHALGAKVIWAMGNHDNRENFRTGLLDLPADDAPVDHTYFINGLRIITLDTSVPGFHHGELSPEQLEWLEAELATPAPDGTILALHHPPVPSVLDLAVLVELRDQTALVSSAAWDSQPSWEQEAREHREILAAARAGDREQVRALMRSHISAFVARNFPESEAE